MVFEHEGDEYVFRRTVDETGASKYILNDKEVSAGDYDNQLKEFGILTKARNFMVYQGDVEALASKSAPELTKLLEQVRVTTHITHGCRCLALINTKKNMID
jgi:structural maintenance of chromosome 1